MPHPMMMGPHMAMPHWFDHSHVAMQQPREQYEAYDTYDTYDEQEGYQHQAVVQEGNAATVEELVSAGASKEGLDRSWQELQAKLEAGEVAGAVSNAADYRYVENNPYLTTEKSVDVNAMLERGMQFHREGRIREAVLCFESVVQDTAGCECDEAWRMLGVCHAENDEDKRAIYCLNKCLDLDPYNLDALLGLGTSYVNELDSVKALETLRTWVAHNPRYQGLDGSALDAYSDGTLMDEVTQLMLTVAAHDPTDIDVKVVLGVLYNVSQDFSAAIDCFAEACAMRPDDYSLINKVSKQRPHPAPPSAVCLRELALLM
jgi:peroxin-5